MKRAKALEVKTRPAAAVQLWWVESVERFTNPLLLRTVFDCYVSLPRGAGQGGNVRKVERPAEGPGDLGRVYAAATGELVGETMLAPLPRPRGTSETIMVFDRTRVAELDAARIAEPDAVELAWEVQRAAAEREARGMLARVADADVGE